MPTKMLLYICIGQGVVAILILNEIKLVPPLLQGKFYSQQNNSYFQQGTDSEKRNSRYGTDRGQPPHQCWRHLSLLQYELTRFIGLDMTRHETPLKL